MTVNRDGSLWQLCQREPSLLTERIFRMNIEEKLIDFKNSVEELSNKDYIEIKKKVEDEINDSIVQEINKYEEKKQASYEKNVQTMEKDCNKKIYNFEIECKKKIIQEEKKIKQKIKERCVEKLKEFVNQEQYKSYLINNIQATFNIIENKNSIDIYLTKNDIEKFGDEIRINYASNLIEMPESNIGGCIVANESQGIFIDNTLLNLLNEIII